MVSPVKSDTPSHVHNQSTVRDVDVRVRGKEVRVRSVLVNGVEFVSSGRIVRIGAMRDEALVEGMPFEVPERYLGPLRSAGFCDVLTFAQKLNDPIPKFSFPHDSDNAAVIPLTTYEDWWEKRLPQETRKNVRRAGKRGVAVRVSAFDDEFVAGIKSIYDETPVRQGRPFWHYQKPIEKVRLENSTYLERSDFVGAYFDSELIGFIKLVYVGDVATLLQIISKNAHQDKRPMNALLSETVAHCIRRGKKFLVYGKYTYGPNSSSMLTEFKRRNGFEEFTFPRYYVPLSAWGRLAVASGLHRGFRHMLPGPLVRGYLSARARFYSRKESERPLSNADN